MFALDDVLDDVLDDMLDDVQVQGPIINFEVLTPEGKVMSYKVWKITPFHLLLSQIDQSVKLWIFPLSSDQEFEREAASAGFHVRTGTECNPGACYSYLGEMEMIAPSWHPRPVPFLHQTMKVVII